MAYALDYAPSCREAIEKATRKNNAMRTAIEKRIAQILDDPERFKPLRVPLAGFRGAHVMKSFVLVFEIDHAEHAVVFRRFRHHDEAYD